MLEKGSIVVVVVVVVVCCCCFPKGYHKAYICREKCTPAISAFLSFFHRCSELKLLFSPFLPSFLVKKISFQKEIFFAELKLNRITVQLYILIPDLLIYEPLIF